MTLMSEATSRLAAAGLEAEKEKRAYRRNRRKVREAGPRVSVMFREGY